MIPYGKQNINEADIQAVSDVLRSDFITQGPQVPLFEQNLCRYTGAAFATAFNSATSALHGACLALGLGPGDCLWTSSISFVASANCALYCGASVDFVDIDPRSYNLCPKALAIKLDQADKDGCLPKIIVAVHLAGQSCDMARIKPLADRYDIRVIEDASHAVGGRYEDKPIGDCRYSDITVFSFHPVKIITTAEGGLALTNSDELQRKMQLARGHGITRDEKLFSEASHGDWYYQQVSLGFNYRMTELQAALGNSQISRLDGFVEKRHRVIDEYEKQLDQLPLTLPYRNSNCYSASHLYIILLDSDRISVSHREVFQYMREYGVGVNLHYIPIHTQPYYRKLQKTRCVLPQAEAYYARALSLPMFPDLSDEQISYVTKTLSSVLV